MTAADHQVTTKEFLSRSASDTAMLGMAIGSRCRGGEIIALRGDLGAGKTQFTKGVGEILAAGREITSPTFIIAQIYSGGRLPLVHMDLYRIASFEEIEEIGWHDFLALKGVVVIEWAERIEEHLPAAVSVAMNYGDGDDERRIVISTPAALSYLIEGL